jgi:hypothetical protein
MDVGRASKAAASSDVVLSICPPSAAEDVAASVTGFTGIYVDANAVSPATAQRIATVVESHGAVYVDGGIIGPPPGRDRSTRLYLSGEAAPEVAQLFHGTSVEARILRGHAVAASALKMVFASWSKGSTALLLSALAAARELRVEDELRGEWDGWRPELGEQASAGARSAAAKGWRWSGEMEEIAATFAAAGLPPGFHLAAAELFSRLPRHEASGDGLDAVLEAIRRPAQV